MTKQQMNEQIQRELSKYHRLISDEEKETFWKQIRQADVSLSKEGRTLINEVIHDDLQKLIGQIKDLLRQVERAKAG